MTLYLTGGTYGQIKSQAIFFNQPSARQETGSFPYMGPVCRIASGAFYTLYHQSGLRRQGKIRKAERRLYREQAASGAEWGVGIL